jgi:predicted nucleic acid-binding protein
MSFLVHRDTCIAWVRGLPPVRNRFLQHQGSLHVSVISLMGLALWLLRLKTPSRYMQGYTAIMQQARVVNVDEPVAARAARLGARLHSQKPRLMPIDLLAAATALERGLTLVTHDTQHYAHVPGLAVVDWMVP